MECPECTSWIYTHECRCGWLVPSISTLVAKPDVLETLRAPRPKNTQPANWMINIKKILGGNHVN